MTPEEFIDERSHPHAARTAAREATPVVAPAVAPVEAPAEALPADSLATEASVRRWLIALVCAYVLTTLGTLVSLPIENAAEYRCHEVVRGMVDSGDWLVPRLQGQVRLQKPPLAYWTGAIASEALGGFSLVALRLPSLAAAVALLLVTFAWGRRVGGARLGLAAAACLAAMELFIALGQRGVAEMQLALYANVALLVFDQALERPGLVLRAAFGVALGLALLAKATAGLMLVLLPAALTLVVQRRWRAALAPRNWIWLVAALGLGLAWYVAILARVPDGWPMLRSELLLPLGLSKDPEALPSAAHYRGPWFHLESLLMGAGPPLVVLLAWTLSRARASRLWQSLPRARFVFIAFASLFVAFSLLPQKQKHYMVPLLPTLAILLADGALARARHDPLAFGRSVRRMGYAGGTFVALFVGTVAAREVWIGEGWGSALLLATVGGSIAAALVVAARRGRPAHVGGVSVAATLVLMLVYGLVFEPRAEPYQPPVAPAAKTEAAKTAPAAPPTAPVEPSGGPAR